MAERTPIRWGSSTGTTSGTTLPLPLRHAPEPFEVVRVRFRKAVFESGQGLTCPCCSQFAKLYRRKLNSGMARALLMLRGQGRHYTDGWVDVTGLGRAMQQLLHHLEYTKLRFWKLIEKHPQAKQSVWRLTDLGHTFAENRVRVSRCVYVYDNEVRGLDGGTTSVREALGDHFDYDELMAG
jgi:hypothetical protein